MSIKYAALGVLGFAIGCLFVRAAPHIDSLVCGR